MPTREQREHWQRLLLAVSEGHCPLHGPLIPIRHDSTVQAAGYCRACDCWWSVNAEHTVVRESGTRPVYAAEVDLGTEPTVPSWARPS